MKEIYKEIIYCKKYLISNYGKVKNKKTNKILKISKRKDNRAYIEIRGEKNKRLIFLISRLVAEHFLENKLNYKIVEHKDDNPLNNNYKNLIWSNQSKNSINKHYRSSKKQLVKVDQYDLENNFLKTFESVSLAAKSISGNKSHITSTCKGKLKTHKKYIWKYNNN